jgi:H+/Cl- antiporter ClcA
VTESHHHRGASLVALLATAAATGAVAGAVGAGFLWLVEEGTELLWYDLPGELGIDGFDSWWLIAIPVAGGALVGLGQRFLGNHPEPLDRTIATWKAGHGVDPATAPRTLVNSLTALTFGGPVGFEAALTGLLGGTATWMGERIGAVARLVRQAWGAESIDRLPAPVRKLPYWLAGVSGLLTFRWLPFGGLDMGFRFEDLDGHIGVTEALAVVAFAALVTVPAAWAVGLAHRAEAATVFRRAPVLVGMAGGLLFALLAVGNELVLFSGQQGIQLLPTEGYSTADLLYVAVAKWLALAIALTAGWRGGPIFPIYTSVAALAVACDGLAGVDARLIMVAGITAVSVVFLKGNIPLALVLSLYAVPFSYTGVMLVAAVGAAAALAVARNAGLVPRDDARPPAGA